MKTAELAGAALDWAVARAEGKHVRVWPAVACQRKHPEVSVYHPNTEWGEFAPSTNWEQGGPIIEREHIDLSWQYGGHTDWSAWHDTDTFKRSEGPTPLIAAMRCYVASKLGDEVDVLKELE